MLYFSANLKQSSAQESTPIDACIIVVELWIRTSKIRSNNPQDAKPEARHKIRALRI
jgi:hypothetical protein